MDSAPSPSRSRRWLAVSGLAVAAVGLAPVVLLGGPSGAANAAPVAAATASKTLTTSTTSTSTVASDSTTTGPAETTTTAPAETTTTGAPSTSTTTEAAPTSPTAAPVTRSAAAVPSESSGSSAQLAQVAAIADSSSFDWRAAGVTIHIGYNPDACCHWGIYDYRDNSLWIGPTAFDSAVRLRYVVLHELGHAWQWASGRRGQLAADMAPWGYSGNDALEYNADCIATVWGAQMDNYWACPAAAQALVARRLAGDWS